jgi:hypothetical protein
VRGSLLRRTPGLIGGLGQIVAIVSNFLLSPSGPLAKTASDTILVLVNRENAETSWAILFGRINFLDEVSVSRILPVLSGIIEKVGRVRYFSCFLSQVFEMAASWAENLSLMEIFFEFFSQFNLPTGASPSRDLVRKVALARVAAVVYYFTREYLSYGISRGRIDATYQWILERFREREDDFLSFPGLTTALNFLRNLPKVDAQFCVDLCRELMFVCPREVTSLVLKEFPRFSKSELLEALSSAVR